jgi:hypothetical protein
MNNLINSDGSLKTSRSIRKLYTISTTTPRVDLCELMDKLYDDALDMSHESNIRAFLWKSVDNVCNVFILIATAIITALGSAASIIGNNAMNNTSAITREEISFAYAIVAISATSFVIKGLTMYFLFRKRALNEKSNSIKLKKIARTVKMLKNTPKLSNQEILRQLDLLYAEIDQIELNTFSTEIGENIGMASNVKATNSGGLSPDIKLPVNKEEIITNAVDKITEVISDFTEVKSENTLTSVNVI